MKNCTEKLVVMGIDLAKNVFQLHGVDKSGKCVYKKRLKRSDVLVELSQLPLCLIGVEACGGSHYWARKLSELGHQVKQMPPQYVKPYVKTNKNDSNDAAAIAEAVTRPDMRFVSLKNEEQQTLQSIHRVRERLVKQHTQLNNQLHGLLLEYGISIALGKAAMKKRLAELTELSCETLPPLLKQLVTELKDELSSIDGGVARYTKRLTEIASSKDDCVRLQSIPGIGVMTATSLVAGINDASEFSNGRGLSAWLGLVPRQCSSGNKQRLLGISKRGDKYLRTLLIHGARSVVLQVNKHEERTDSHSQWIRQLLIRCGMNKTIVALANKNARMAFAVLNEGTQYNDALAHNQAA